MDCRATQLEETRMRLGLHLPHWGLGPRTEGDSLALTQEAERLGFAVVWAPEAYGSDAVTVLTWLAAHTSRIDLGSAVLQIPARSPAMTAMTAATLDVLSGGRFRLGLGVSGPQVSEGWHGVAFRAPLARTREYVEIVRMALRREQVVHPGEHYPLPLPNGPGKPLKLSVRRVRREIPVYLAAIGPRNLELAGEIADGWLPLWFSADHAADQLDHVRTGRRRAGKDLTGFDVAPSLQLAVGPDVAACADQVRQVAALYVGGMGSRQQNFYNDVAVRMGYGEKAARVQDLYLNGQVNEAAAAMPFGFLDQTSLLGPAERIAERVAAYAAVGVTTLTVSPTGTVLADRVAALRAVAAAVEQAGMAG
jgi:F420-dependent oxidoreductase-like protein